MSGEMDLSRLLEGMTPVVMDGDYVFCTVPGGKYGDHLSSEPFAAVAEAEGLTLVLSRAMADMHGMAYGSVFRLITLSVHSSLDAVGLTAAVSTVLAEHGITANVIAGFFHDHIFVPRESADLAIMALHRLATSAGAADNTKNERPDPEG